MACVGFDVGGRSSVMAHVSAKGLKTLLNKGSGRSSSTLASLKDNRRFLASDADPLLRSNYKNTLWYASRLVGRKFADPEVQRELELMPYPGVYQESKEGGGVDAVVQYNGETHRFSALQIYAMILGELQRLVTAAVPGAPDVVLTVPCWFDDKQRRDVQSACRIAQVRCVQLINDTTAVSLQYGIWKQKRGQFSKTEPSNVMFVNFGASQLTCCVVRYVDGQLQTLTTTHDKMLGGRVIDLAITNHLADEFKAQTGCDVRTNPKSFIKLMTVAEKAKKTLSGGVPKVAVNCECLMNDRDLRTHLTLEKIEGICQPLLEQFSLPIKRALNESGLAGSDFAAVEILGGSMRLPIFKRQLASLLGTDGPAPNHGLCTTLDMEEAAAHGAALQCALLSPKFQLRTTFEIIDSVMYPIRLAWGEGAEPPIFGAASPEDQESKSAAPVSDNAVVLFERNSRFGNSSAGERTLSFRRNQNFSLHATYTPAVSSSVPSGEQEIATFTINDVPSAGADGDAAPWVVVRLHQDGNGILQMKGAQYTKVEEIEVPTAPESSKAAEKTAAPEAATENQKDTPPEADGKAASEATDAESTDTGGKAADAAAAEPAPEAAAAPSMTKKRKFSEVSLAVDSRYTFAMASTKLMELEEKEASMTQTDRIIRETEDARNAVETYVYDMRESVDYGSLKEYVAEDEKAPFTAILTAEEDWLYTEEGESAKKSVYVQRLKELQKRGEVFTRRKAEEEGRQGALDALMETTARYRGIVTGSDEKYAHLTEEQKTQVLTTCDGADQWAGALVTQQSSLPKSTDPVLRIADLNEKRKAVDTTCRPIVNTPKPKPPPETKADEAGKVDEAGDSKSADAADNTDAGAKGEGEKMDVDAEGGAAGQEAAAAQEPAAAE